MIKKLRALSDIFGIALFCYFALLLFSPAFAYHENIAISFDPDLVSNRLVLIEKDQNTDKWKIKSINSEPIKRENHNQEVLSVNILREKDAIYVQPFFEKDSSWNLTGGRYHGDNVYFICKVGSKDTTKFTPCSSNFTSFVKTEFFFLAGSSTYRLSKSKIIDAIKETDLIHKVMEIERERERESKKHVEDKKINLLTDEQLPAQQKTLTEPIPEFDGMYILTTDNFLIEVPIATYDHLNAYDEISHKDKWLYGGASKISISFKTDQYHKIPINRFKALIIKGYDLSNIELRLCRRQIKLFSSEFSNEFKFYPDERFTLMDFKRKSLDKSVFYFEPAHKKVLGDMNSGIYFFISHKSNDVPWSSFTRQQKGMLGFASDKPTFWLIGSY